MEKKQVYKDHQHDHYWIENGELFESYMTLRGLRYRFIMDVPGMEDCDDCTPEMIEEIESKFLSENNPNPVTRNPQQF